MFAQMFSQQLVGAATKVQKERQRAKSWKKGGNGLPGVSVSILSNTRCGASVVVRISLAGRPDTSSIRQTTFWPSSRN